ncbi:sigma-70 family RNA polymerase sigma factor [Planctomicrobium sp.]|nr:sigma-70 family RNA polymerase sigma factor [Planctomicrobium sp.]
MLDNEQQVSFTDLWVNAQADVAAYVRAVVRDPHATTDIVQNTAVVLLRKFESWDSSREFLPWAVGIAKFEILAHRRDSARRRVVLGDELLDSITEMWSSVTVEIELEESALHECLEKLEPKAREIVRLRYFEDLKTPQIADLVNSTQGAVRIALMRIRRQLLSCVNNRLETL